MAAAALGEVHPRAALREADVGGEVRQWHLHNDGPLVGDFINVLSPPWRDEQLRPLRGVPAAPPESLAFGWGRRHIASVNCNLYLFLEVRAPVRGVVVAVDYMVMVLALVRKGLSRGYEVSFGGLLPRERVRDFFV